MTSVALRSLLPARPLAHANPPSRWRGVRAPLAVAVAVAAVAVALAGCAADDEGEETSAAATGGLPTTTTGLTGTGGAATDGPSGTAGGSDSASGDDSSARLDVGGAGSASASGSGGETGPAVCMQDVDIVFVMDVSTTMAAFFTRLESEILAVDQAVNALQLPSPARYGLVVFVDDVLMANGAQPFADAAALRADFERWNAFTSGNGQPGGSGGSNSTFPENSLDALHAAATAFPWRPAETTLRIVIHTTDDTFWDGPTNANGVAIQWSYAQTVAALQQNEVRMFTFADRFGGPFGDEDVSAGFFTPYMGMAPIPDQTDGQALDINNVLSGAISLADALSGVVDDNLCEPYPPAG